MRQHVELPISLAFSWTVLLLGWFRESEINKRTFLTSLRNYVLTAGSFLDVFERASMLSWINAFVTYGKIYPCHLSRELPDLRQFFRFSSFFEPFATPFELCVGPRGAEGDDINQDANRP